MIESPETDKAYLSALSNWYNLKRMADRSKVLVHRKLISQQEADQAFANADIAASSLETQRVLKSYEVIRAPFDGTIANRYVDVGALLANSTNGQSPGGAVFEISQNDRLRIYAYPDQPDAVFIKTGTPVEISFNEKPEVKIPARRDTQLGTPRLQNPQTPHRNRHRQYPRSNRRRKLCSGKSASRRRQPPSNSCRSFSHSRK